MNAKALECRASFSTHTGCFCPKKKRSFLQIITERAKILARTQTLLKARFENKSANEKVFFHERARESLFVLTSSESVWKTRFIQKTFWERRQSERECERISFVSSSKLRGVLDERTSDQRRRRRRSERRFEIIRSFGDFSRSGRAWTFILLNERTTTRTTKREKKGDIREKSAGF